MKFRPLFGRPETTSAARGVDASGFVTSTTG